MAAEVQRFFEESQANEEQRTVGRLPEAKFPLPPHTPTPAETLEAASRKCGARWEQQKGGHSPSFEAAFIRSFVDSALGGRHGSVDGSPIPAIRRSLRGLGGGKDGPALPQLVVGGSATLGKMPKQKSGEIVPPATNARFRQRLEQAGSFRNQAPVGSGVEASISHHGGAASSSSGQARIVKTRDSVNTGRSSFNSKNGGAEKNWTGPLGAGEMMHQRFPSTSVGLDSGGSSHSVESTPNLPRRQKSFDLPNSFRQESWSISSTDSAGIATPGRQRKYVTPPVVKEAQITAITGSPRIWGSKQMLVPFLPAAVYSKRNVVAFYDHGRIQNAVDVLQGITPEGTMPTFPHKQIEGLLKALGAQVIRTKTNVKYTDPDSDYGVALRLAEQIPNSIYINQFMNISNPMVHYDITAEEILHQCDGKIDMFVAGCGTGGTLTGVGRKLKEVIPDIQVVGIDPLGSVVAYPDALNDETKGQPYEVEGIGRPFVPLTCDRYMIDKWVKVHDKDAFYMARRLIKEEGILCGGSSGMHFYGALEVAKDLSENQRCVVLLPDGMRNYV